MSVCFIFLENEPQIELIAPLGEASPIKRVLSGGGGAYHFCYEVVDLDHALIEIRAKEVLGHQRTCPSGGVRESENRMVLYPREATGRTVEDA